MNHTHLWIPVNSYLTECSVCGKLKTTSAVRTNRTATPVEDLVVTPEEPRPLQVRQPKVIDEGPDPMGDDTMSVQEIVETYGVSSSTVYKAFKRRNIYRVRLGQYDRKSVEGHFGDSRGFSWRPDHRNTTSTPSTKGHRVIFQAPLTDTSGRF